MPRPKGSKNVPKDAPRTHCATCGKILPIAALIAWDMLLQNIRASLGANPPEGAGTDDHRRFRTLQVVHARASLEMLSEEQQHVCMGHEPIRRGPRKPAIPLDITRPEPKARGRGLTAVSNDD